MRSDHPLLAKLSSVAALADAEFARGARLHGARIQCRAGCSSCCGQLFRITEPEAVRIGRFVAQLDAATREQMRASAREYLRRRAEFLGAETWDSPLPQGAHLPCPALGAQGECRIYEARPVICRKFGVPIYNPEKPQNVMACELNFRPGEPIEDDELVERQTNLFRAQQQLQADWNAAGGARSEKPLCVASALAQDLRGLLPLNTA
jgi:Fe-S-cluster containining protein